MKINLLTATLALMITGAILIYFEFETIGRIFLGGGLLAELVFWKNLRK